MRPPLIPAVLILLAAHCQAAAAEEAAAPAAPALTHAPMLKKVAPTVVTVFSSRRPQAGAPPWIEEDPILGRMLPQEPRGQQRRRQQGLGSGVVVRSDGYLLTNNHVVEGADEVKVAFAADQHEFLAKVVGADPKTDLAVLKIDVGGRSLPTIEFGDSAKVETGDVVFAVGNPFGVGQTVTMGIVSAVGRGVGLADYEDFLQTDASINPGNSGGALVDSNGRLVGINTAIISPTGANLGIGFAVPVNLARGIATGIIEHGRVVRGSLGVMIQPLSPALSRELGLKSESGALVTEVMDDSAAAKAGLASGDVIVAIDGAKVDDARQLRLTVAAKAPGSEVRVTALRDGKEVTVTATLQDLAAGEQVKRPQKPTPAERGDGRLGIRIEDLGDDARRAFRIPRDVTGAVVVEVKSGSRADEAGLRPGMVIVEVERKPVTDAEAAAGAIDEAEGDLLLRVWNEGGRLYLVIPRG